MGRRPDQLVLEFFERGPKLADSSNRYQQTCKSCGEVFPKGRSDNLKSHLKRCSRLSQRDRARLLRGSHSQEQLRTTSPELNLTSQLRLASQEREMNAMPSPAWPDAMMNSSVDTGHGSRASSVSSPSVLPISQLLSPTPPPPEHASARPMSSATWVDSASKRASPVTVHAQLAHAPDFVLNMNRRTPMLPSITTLPSPEMAPGGSSYPAQRMMYSSPLAAPSFTLEPSMSPGPSLPPLLSRSTSASSLSDQYYRSSYAPRYPHDPIHGGYASPPMEIPSMQMAKSSVAGWATSSDRYAEGAGFNPVIYVPLVESRPPRGQKRNVRSKFDDGRRKEVQGVRALGACIRCKMLKKPCSGGDPCKTCSNIGNARVWAFPCTRDRMQDLLQVNSDTVDTLVSLIEEMEPSRRFLTAMHEGNDEISIVLDGMRITRINNLLMKEPQAYVAGRDTELMALNPTSERVGSELLRYSQRKFPEFVAAERSIYASRTLEMAQKLRDRSQDLLIEKILNLWALLPILTDKEPKWCTYVAEGIDSQRAEISETSYRIIIAQLRAEAEKRAANLTKQILNDLERRLFQRAQGGWFETVLVAMLLTMCVEKQMWLLERWERGVYKPLEKWPAEKSLAQCQERTEEFVGLLGMLLKLGGLSSKIKKDQNGNIFSDDKHAKGYFEQLGLTESMLDGRQQSTFDPHDPLSYELKLCSKLLLLSI